MALSRTGMAGLLLSAWLLLCGLTVKAAETGSQDRSNLTVQRFDPGPDVRERSIRTLLRSHDGYLWIGTERGLIRFDGVTFTNFALEGASGIRVAPIAASTLWEGQDDVLWAGTDNKSLIRFDHGAFTTIEPGPLLPPGELTRIDGDTTGATWVFTPLGVSRIQSGRITIMHPERDGPPESEPVRFAARTTPDVVRIGLWRRTPAGIERFAYGRWRAFPLPEGAVDQFSHDVKNIYEDDLHRVWFALFSRPGRYYCVEQEQLRSWHGIPSGYFITYMDRSGYLWLTDHRGHSARWKDGRRFPIPGFHSPFLLNVIERDDGLFWLGAAQTSLYLLRPRLIETILTRGAPERGAVLFRQRNGSVWVAGDGVAHHLSSPSEITLQRLQSGQLKQYSAAVPLRSLSFRDALSEDSAGRLLFNVDHPFMLKEVQGSRTQAAQPYPHIKGTVFLAFLDRLQQQWFATDAGLLLLKTGATPESVRLVTPLRITCFLETSAGELWAGTPSGPVLIEGEQLVWPAELGRWNYGTVNSIDVDAQGSLWIGTDNSGLIRYRDHRLTSFTQSEGLPAARIDTVQAGDERAIWLKTDVGLVRIARAGLDQRPAHPDSVLQVRVFDEGDGLPSAAMYPGGNQGSLRLPDGHLWFSTVHGIAAVDPSAIQLTNAHPRVSIEEHSIDQGSIASGDRIRMEPGQNSLELRYTALGANFPAAIEFRYRLDGVDPHWIRAGTRRRAWYSHLEPGEYRFHVQAAAGDGAWSEPEAVAVIQVVPPWYRQFWLRLLAACFCLGMLVFVIWRRQQRVAERIRLRQVFTHKLISSQEAERKRIAHDLHDSLGQHLALILAHLRTRRSDPHRVSELLNQIEEQAEAAIQEVQAISHNLRPHQLDRLGLTSAVLSLIRNIEEASSLEIKAQVADIDDALPRELQIDFYRIVQEALGNVLRHSNATAAEIQIECHSSSVRLRIADNGKGFDHTRNSSYRGLGLLGIAERAEALGGRARVTSREGSGTEVLVLITGLAALARKDEGVHV